MVNGICDRHCKGCVYLSYLNNSHYLYCSYILKTGKRRPCPAGTGCTVKQTGSKVNAWAYPTEQQEKPKAAPKPRRRAKIVRHLVCPSCGKEFDTTSSIKIFCSFECKERERKRAYHKRKKLENGTNNV